MALRYLGRQQLKRLNPFEGLMIDAAAWSDAHRYHQDHERLHALALHHSGIVAGLEVTANDPPDLSVTIHPGLAIDPEGNFILVTQPQRYYLQPKGRGAAYLIIEFREVGVERATYDGDQPTRILEAYRIQQRETLPDMPYVELARFQIESAAQPIRDPRNVLAPAPHEIDGRFRPQSTIRPQGEVAIGLLVPKAGGSAEGLVLQGLRNLARELSLQCGYRAPFLGAVELGQQAGDCGLLYVTGARSLSFDQYELTALAAFIRSGGVLVGEVCDEGRGGGQNGGFVVGFKAIAQRLGCNLAPVARGHPLLDSRHPFAAPPEGAAASGELLEGSGVIYSSMDYGCAWAGGHEGRPLGRSSIREALEFGVNMAVYADARRQRAALKQA